MSNAARLDEIDLKLLEMLQEHGRVSQHDLAVAVGLSSPAVGERVRKLEERGIIRGFTAVLDPKLLGRDVGAIIFTGIAGSQFYPEFRRRVAEHPEILECYTLMGETDFLLRIVCRDIKAYEAFFLDHLSRFPGVQSVHSSIALSVIKETTALPLR